MKILTRRFEILIFLILFTLFSPLALAAQSTPPAAALHMTGQIYYKNIEGGFYGIIGDDGIKYQPTNLPRKFKKEGLNLKFNAKMKSHMVNAFQWGTIVELSEVSEFKTDLTIDERRAIFVLLKRMEAFNNKDLSQLQQIDLPSKQLTAEQFDSWVSKYGNYTLRYVDILSANSTSITGACYYTRELVNGMTMHGNTDLAMMTFTMSNQGNTWKLVNQGSLTNPIFADNTDILTDLKEKALKKYKTDNLATLWQ